MKAITIKQPWASLIVHGIKDIENRTWPCPKKYLGQRVLIHSSAVPMEMINPNSVFTKRQWDSFSLGFQSEIICGNGYVNSVYHWKCRNCGLCCESLFHLGRERSL